MLFNTEIKIFDYVDENYSLMKAIIGSLHNLSKTVIFEDDLDATNILVPNSPFLINSFLSTGHYF